MDGGREAAILNLGAAAVPPFREGRAGRSATQHRAVDPPAKENHEAGKPEDRLKP